MKISEYLRELQGDVDGNPPTVEYLRDKLGELIVECGKLAHQVEKLEAFVRHNVEPDLRHLG